MIPKSTMPVDFSSQFSATRQGILFDKIRSIRDNTLLDREIFVEILKIVNYFFVPLITIRFCRTPDPGFIALVDCHKNGCAGYSARGQEPRDPLDNVVGVDHVQDV